MVATLQKRSGPHAVQGYKVDEKGSLEYVPTLMI